MTEPRKLRVFLCHASQDKPVVRELYQRLLAEGWIDPWLDEEKLLPGQDWNLEIEKAVESADVVIVCLSKSSIDKEGYIQKELKQALDISEQKPEGTIFIIPLRLQNVKLPHRLNFWQYTDFFSVENKITNYERLIASLRLRAEKQSKDLSNVRRVKSRRRVPSNELIRLIKAIDIVCKSQYCYPFLLQRHLMIGYLSVLNLIDELEEIGVVGPEIMPTSNTDHKREVLLSFQSVDGENFSLKQTIESVLEEQWIGVSALQQKMKVDYQSALKLFSIMGKLGIIGLEKNDKEEVEVLILQGVFQ